VAQIIQAQMEEIEGLTFELKPVDGPTISTDARSGNYQLMMGATLSSHMDRLYEVFHSEGSLNNSNYSNPTVDEALETTRTSNDQDEVA
jgi:peptide/nickel transport system substrate-binding protein